MDAGEERIKQEDCAEDTLGSGILTLTNKRIAFDKSRGRIMDFARKFEDTVIDVPLNDIDKVWKEGMLIKKICFSTKSKDPSTSEKKTYKFGVFSTGDWLEHIQDVLEYYRDQ